MTGPPPTIPTCCKSCAPSSFPAARCWRHFHGKILAGFAAVTNEPFGPAEEYLQLSELNVSQPLRGQGIGRELFRLACEQARIRGAQKLYLSAHSAEETQAFYRAMGRVEAAWYHPELVALEPCDCQMEFLL